MRVEHRFIQYKPFPLVMHSTCPLDPLALFELIRLVVMRQRNGVPILVAQHAAGVSDVGHGELPVGQQRHKTCGSCGGGGVDRERGNSVRKRLEGVPQVSVTTSNQIFGVYYIHVS